MSSDQFFNPIDKHDIQDILSKAIRANTICNVKILDQFYRLLIVKLNSDHILIEKKSFFKIKSEKIVVQFHYKDDQYVFSTTATSDEDFFKVQIPEKIFKIQRRNDFRLRIPDQISPLVKLKSYPELKVKLIDLSLGGCRLSVKTMFPLNFKMSQDIELSLKVMDFEEPHIITKLKFQNHSKDLQETILGLQFENIDLEQAAQIRGVLIQIDRILRGKTDD